MSELPGKRRNVKRLKIRDGGDSDEAEDPVPRSQG